jgi:hypothetical protein
MRTSSLVSKNGDVGRVTIVRSVLFKRSGDQAVGLSAFGARGRDLPRMGLRDAE